MRVGTFLPGVLEVGKGTRGDYEGLARFHYLGGRPAVVGGVWVVRYWEGRGGAMERRSDGGGEGERRTFNVQRPTLNGGTRAAGGAAQRGEGGRVVAVGVVAFPTPRCRGREQVFGLSGLSYREKILWANANVRTIARVVVHPQFRGVGLASLLVRECCAGAGTKYVEALAVMGRGHPFFEKGGMKRVEVEGGREGGAVYYLYGKTDSLWRGDEGVIGLGGGLGKEAVV